MSDVMLVLDLDDTVIPWGLGPKETEQQVHVVHDLLDFCDKNNIEYAVNTARTVKSYAGVRKSVKDRLKDKLFCHRSMGAPVSTSKEACMHRLSKEKLRKNVILMDDNKENCDEVKKAAYDAIHVKPDGKGITRQNVELFKKKAAEKMRVQYRASIQPASSISFTRSSSTIDYNKSIIVSQSKTIGRPDFVDIGDGQHINREWLDVDISVATLVHSHSVPNAIPKLPCIIRRGEQDILIGTTPVSVVTGDMLVFPSTALNDRSPISYRIDVQTPDTEASTSVKGYECPYCHTHLAAKGRHNCLSRHMQPDAQGFIPKKRKAIEKVQRFTNR